jgi:hypothetical protein
VKTTADGLSRKDVDAHADWILGQASRRPGFVIEIRAWSTADGFLKAQVRVWLDPDGHLVFDAAAAGTLFGAELIQSLERKGAGNRIRIFRVGGAE